MNFHHLSGVRSSVESDHCYLNSISHFEVDNEIYAARPFNTSSSECWIDVESSNSDISSSCLHSYIPSNLSECTSKQFNFHSEESSSGSPHHTWTPCEKLLRKKIVYCLSKSLKGNKMLNSSYFDVSSPSVCLKVLGDHNMRRNARTLRKVFAELSWRIENCFGLHVWCILSLPDHMLSLYCAAFCKLWSRSKINCLPKTLHMLLQERGIEVPSTYYSYIRQSLLDLRESDDYFDSRQATKRTLVQHIPEPNTMGVFSANMGTLLACRRARGDEITLVCMTFPASRNSKRISRFLRHLSSFATISVESSDEQTCDSMRTRLRLFIRRVITMLEESKNGAVYLIGFGVGTLLVLLSAVHLHSLDQRIDRVRANLSGIICVGLPVVGLKGTRGGVNDPLLSLPSVPTIFIIGSGSRLGNYKQASEFRRKLLASRISPNISQMRDGYAPSNSHQCAQRNKFQCFKSQQIETPNRSYPVFHIFVVGGADYLLRMRPSTCTRWCTTQNHADTKISEVIKNFVHANNYYSQVSHIATVENATTTSIFCNRGQIDDPESTMHRVEPRSTGNELDQCHFVDKMFNCSQNFNLSPFEHDFSEHLLHKI